MALAQLPPRAAAAYAISGMTALLKEEVPHRKVRGIVTGSSLRRLVARTFVQQEQETIAAACAPYQFALGTRAGTDALEPILESTGASKKKMADDCGFEWDDETQTQALARYRKIADGITRKRAIEARQKKFKTNHAR